MKTLAESAPAASSQPVRKKDWELMPAAFERFLARLSAEDREASGEKYEAVRRKLMQLFVWWGSEVPEEHADETIDRVVRKLWEGEEIQDLNRYLTAVARLLYKEHVKERIKQRAALADMPLPEAPEEASLRAVQHECYELCLEQLTAEERELVVRYYQNEERKKVEQRQQLAELLGVPLNALRVRAFRIRNKLKECVGKCGEKHSPQQ